MAAEEIEYLDRAQRKLPKGLQPLHQPNAIQTSDLNPLDRKPCVRHQASFHTLARADKDRLMPAVAQFVRNRQGRNDVPSGTPARHNEFHPACSLTLNSIPREISVLSSELPPYEIIGKGMPFDGPISRTTLILKIACRTTETVIPSAR